MRSQVAARLILILSLIGLGLAGYLYYIHLGLLRGELLGGAVCSGAGQFNCHAVTAGPWGSFLGIPLALWGALAYVAFAGLALLAHQSEEWAGHALAAIALLALLAVAVDVALFGLMAFVIRFYCLFCLLTYAVNLLILIASAQALGRPWLRVFASAGQAIGALMPARARPQAALFWGLMAVAALGLAGIHASNEFITRGPAGAMRKQLQDYIARQPARGIVALDHDPMQGPANAPIQMVEFSDFMCPACQRASKLNPVLLAGHHRDIAFVFKNYPLDTACNSHVQSSPHPGACQLAAAGECAHAQGKFWPLHDVIFEKGHDYKATALDDDARRVGLDVERFRACMASGEGLEAVKRDIEEGAARQVMSTPTYIVNGVPVTGGFNPVMFEEFLSVLRER
ncbi:MAG: thioredoxin domain-containing protein [Candidatus Omnitrophica bacterium]|nr:thioredoxin domain-containing protein [Candidatus Omnitrophota bacterium]